MSTSNSLFQKPSLSPDYLEKIEALCLDHRIEVLMQDDHLYHCFIGWPECTGSYGSGLTFIQALTNGVDNFLRENPDAIDE